MTDGPKLRGYSFHSVKGGVGKSTLSTLAALELAQKHPDDDVWLIDLDLTGTSLADALPIQAPDLGAPTVQLGKLRSPPSAHLSVADSITAVERRGEHLEGRAPTDDERAGALFLNDWLLHAQRGWTPGDELPLAAVSWRLHDGPPNLRVLPSSALPEDLRRTIPVVFDEEFAGFFEARIEWLLEAITIAGAGRPAHVVIDVPPTIPGLSRAVLGVALRLASAAPVALADDGFIPEHLRQGIAWRASMVTTLDLPDLRAMGRWLKHVRSEDEQVIRVVLNRVAADWSDGQLNRALSSCLGLQPTPELKGETVAGDRSFELAPATVDDTPDPSDEEEGTGGAGLQLPGLLQRAVAVREDRARQLFTPGAALKTISLIDALDDQQRRLV
jgi:hypothetical protein